MAEKLRALPEKMAALFIFPSSMKAGKPPVASFRETVLHRISGRRPGGFHSHLL